MPTSVKEPERFRVLVVDDEPVFLSSLGGILASRGFDVVTYDDPERALACLAAEHDDLDLVLIDRDLAGVDGLGVLARAGQIAPDVSRIVMAPSGGEATASAALNAGAFHFLSKPITDPDAMALTLLRGAHLRRLQRKARMLEDRVAGASTSEARLERPAIAVGTSPPGKPIVVGPDRLSPVEEYRTARREILGAFDREYFGRLLERTGGNLSEASRLSGIDRSNLRRALARLGLRSRRGDGTDADA
jgi:DNA-binding NtrC family response regulator